MCFRAWALAEKKETNEHKIKAFNTCYTSEIEYNSEGQCPRIEMKPPLLRKLIAVKPYKNTILIKLSASRLGNLAAPTKGQ